MEIILTQDIQSLGQKDDIIAVKDGYARNFLIPKKLAVIATPSARKVLAENIKQRAHKEAKLRESALEVADKLKAITVVVGAKTSTTGKIFGSVNNIMLAEAINAQGFDVDRRSITITDDTIKEVGKFTAKIKLYKDVIVDFPIEVVSE
jgi:large subunit ribosomal protein L9